MLRMAGRVGHLREGRQDGYPDHRQEEVPRPISVYFRLGGVMAGVLSNRDAGSHCGPVRLRDPEAYQARTGEGDLHLRG